MKPVGGRERLSAITAPSPQKWVLDNGLRVLYLPVRRASLVTSVVCYPAGTAGETAEQAGISHFLEHMMFKGSGQYGPGEIDRKTQLLGGWNNAFTSHDSTVYFFGFASDRWREAVAIEADRMAGLTLDPEEVASERDVIVEEIAMYLDDPWDALELEVHERLFGDHPYGRPILGTPESLAGIDAQKLREFHRRNYGPENAVLVIAGDVDRSAVEDVVAEHFESMPGRQEAASALQRSAARLRDGVRVERRKGDTARLLLAMPGPSAGDPDHAALVLALAILSGGRVSRMQRNMVEEMQLCSRVSADITEAVDPGMVSVSAEVMPGVEPAVVEEEVLKHLRQLVEESPSEGELERAKSLLAADWVFGHERIHQQAILVAIAEAVFSTGHPAMQLRALGNCTLEQVTEAARTYLLPERRSVTGWSLPGDRQQEIG